MEQAELVVLANDQGDAIGTLPKHQVHTQHTPLHLAFSCYVRDTQGKVLITRRALDKLTWPGVWTNSACGHLAPEESAIEAVRRRVPHELGLTNDDLIDIQLVLPDFRYYATDSRGLVENEICPVFVATLSEGASVQPHQDEVDSYHWVDAADLIAAVARTPFAFSPWMVEQLGHQDLVDVLSS